jgi:hypothetical protein
MLFMLFNSPEAAREGGRDGADQGLFRPERSNGGLSKSWFVCAWALATRRVGSGLSGSSCAGQRLGSEIAPAGVS